MRIGVDIMGGDYAPEAVLLGSVLARKELTDEVEVVLFGDKCLINQIITSEEYDSSGFTVFHTTDTIRMEDHPAKVYSQKPGSAMVLGLQMLKKGELDGFTSAGNTGALLVASMKIINSIPGVIRPCITASVPNDYGAPTILLDVGLNPDAGGRDILADVINYLFVCRKFLSWNNF